LEDELRYVKIDKNFKDLDKVETLYSRSFPPEERMFSVRQAMEQEDKIGVIEAAAAYDGELLIGFYVTLPRDGYRYLNYLVTDPAIRGMGYGGAIVRKILEDNMDGICFGSIEKPVPGTDDYETRLRRQMFYERNGMITVPYEKEVNGIPFIIVTNRTGEEFDRCYQKEMKLADIQMAAAKQ